MLKTVARASDVLKPVVVDDDSTLCNHQVPHYFLQ